jgi:hypothetical protein
MDRFLVAPMDEGIKQDVKPWLIPDTAFESLKNAYVFRGRVRKRFGSEYSGQGAVGDVNAALYSKLCFPLVATAIKIGTTSGVGALAATVVPGSDYRIGQKFVIGAERLGAVANIAPWTLANETGGAGNGTFNTVTGAVTLAACAINTDVYYYPYGIGVATSAVGYVKGIVPGTKWRVGQQLSIGNDVFTVVDNTAGPQDMITTSAFFTTPAAIMTFNCTTGEFEIQYDVGHFPAPTQVYFYPCDPVMGLTQYETTPINNQVAYAFDTQFIYYYTGGRWVMSGPEIGYRFHGSDAEFFWACNYQGTLTQDVAMFVTNNHVLNVNGAADITDDNMWYYLAGTWTKFKPKFITAGAGNYVQTARIVLPFKRRLLLFNTIERNTADTANSKHGNRCRFSWDGSPLDANAWLEPNQLNGQGGSWVDAGTEEEIIGAEYIKDRLIVYFERSTWEIAYTGNEVEPFQWNKLNTELGSESGFSTVPFDKVVLTIGTNGIHACNGSNVDRVDSSIPDYVYQFSNTQSGVARIHGIRDYKTEMVYWSYPASYKMANSYFPNTVLVYNYKNNAWAENDDCITCWGYFEQSTDKRWQDMNIRWQQANMPWNAYLQQAQERLILIGNQQGFVTILNPYLANNAFNMSITNFTHLANVGTLTIMNHTLRNDDFIQINIDPAVSGIGLGSLSNIYKVTVVDANTITMADPDGIVGVYLGGATVARVSAIDIKTKQWNFYLKDGAQFLINKMDFLVTKGTGEITTDFHINSSNVGMRQESFTSHANLGSYCLEFGALDTMSQTQERVWNSVYFSAEGSTIQLHLYYDDAQMIDLDNAYNFFELHAIMIHASKTRTTLGGVYSGY